MCWLNPKVKVKHTLLYRCLACGMEGDRDHLQQQAERARRWAEWLPDPDRERREAVARDYETMAQAAERAPASLMLRSVFRL